MKTFLFIIILISSNSFAKVSQGDTITAKKFNESTFGLGDIKHSLLTESQFQSQFGNCWVKMIGQCVSSSCGSNESDYATLTGNSTLPNTSGRFLRDTGGNASSLGTTQEDSFQGHAHVLYALDRSGDGNNSLLTHSGSGNAKDITSINQDGEFSSYTTDSHHGTPRVSNETRPQNLSVNYFVKINNECN